MSYEIEADFVGEWMNEESQCRNCTGFINKDGFGYCNEARAEVPEFGHCDYFQARD